MANGNIIKINGKDIKDVEARQDISESRKLISQLQQNAITTDQTQKNFYEGYDSHNTQTSRLDYAPYVPMPFISNAVVIGLELDIATTGTFTIGIYRSADIYDGASFASDKYIIKYVLNIENVGEQTIMFPEPLYVPIGYAFGIGANTDGATFKYGAFGRNKEFFYNNSGVKWRVSPNSLGVTILGIVNTPNEIKSTLDGKKLSIFGDSISTFAGYIPNGNATYYTGSNAGVSSVDDTWWMKSLKALGMSLLINNSWSGRAVSNIRDTQSAHSTDAGYKEANVLQLKDGTTLPDIIIVKLGINDFDYGCPLGTYNGSTALPTDPSTFTNAYAMMLDLIMTNFPLAKVYCCTLMAVEKNGSIGFPEINTNGDTISEWNNAIKQLASAFGASVLDHEACGITYYNLSTYMGDWSSSAQTGLHPNADGHSLIANQTIYEMDNAVRTRY